MVAQWPDPEGCASPGVAEMQGWYGAYSFPERLLQKIWLLGHFDRSALVTQDGRRLQVRHPGRWNLLGGPDFTGARLGFDDGPEVMGDVELHLRAEGWDAHGHAADRAYDGVVLHVVLFPPDHDRITRAHDGRNLPVLVLLPWLHHDLEQFAAEEAIESLASRPASQLLTELAPLSADELAARLRSHALRRWQQKVRFARLRLKRLGWVAACHHAALEILGYRFNRAPMLRVAAAWPLAQWARGEVDPDLVAATETWSLQGVRPANRPRLRLRQYAAWNRAAGDWPERLRNLGPQLPLPPLDQRTGRVRQGERLARLRLRMAEDLCGGVVGGTRFDNLICDGFLPLLAAELDREFGLLWFHWYPGDVPPLLNRTLRILGATTDRAQPFNHGRAQGLLGWLIERDAIAASENPPAIRLEKVEP